MEEDGRRHLAVTDHPETFPRKECNPTGRPVIYPG
jgi:hypothetical protein